MSAQDLKTAVAAVALGVGVALLVTAEHSPPTEETNNRKEVKLEGEPAKGRLLAPEEGRGEAPPPVEEETAPVPRELIDEEELRKSVEDLMNPTFDSAVQKAAEQNRPLLVIVSEDKPGLPELPSELLVVHLKPDDRTEGKPTNRERFTSVGNPIPCALLYPKIKWAQKQPDAVRLDFDKLSILDKIYPLVMEESYAR